MTEHRHHKRIRKEFKITWKDQSVSFSGITMDICQGGVFVVTDQPVPPKSVLDLELWIGEESPLHFRGEVVWLNRGEVMHYPPGFGIQFKVTDRSSLSRLLPACCSDSEPGFEVPY